LERRQGESPTVDIVSFAPGHCFAIWRTFVLVVWRQAPTRDAVEELTRILKQHALRTANRMYLLGWITEGSGVPSTEAREALVRGVRTMEGRVAAYAFVFEGGGFGVAAKRAVMTAMTSLTGVARTTKVFGSTAAAAAWLSSLPMGTSAVQAQDIIEAEYRLRLTMEGRETSG
jgi:hypothetical protein